MSAADRVAALDRLRVLAARAGDPEMIDLVEELIDRAGADAPGQRTVRTMADMAERDHHLREAARIFNLDATSLATELARYVSRSWSRDRTAETCPNRLRGRVQAHLWAALRARPVAPGPKQLGRILGHELPVFMSSEITDPDAEREPKDVR